MHLVLYGPEGCGKGTQAELLAKILKLKIYTSGDLVREAATKNSGSIGQECRNALAEGRYVSDATMYLLWEKKLKSKQAQKGFILDGFPRTLNQAKFLFGKSADYGYKIDKIIHFNIGKREILTRLIKRKRKLFSGSRISHDTPRRIEQRLKMYYQQEKELLNFFRQKKILLEVNGNQSIKEVFASIIKRLQVNNK